MNSFGVLTGFRRPKSKSIRQICKIIICSAGPCVVLKAWSDGHFTSCPGRRLLQQFSEENSGIHALRNADNYPGVALDFFPLHTRQASQESIEPFEK